MLYTSSLESNLPYVRMKRSGGGGGVGAEHIFLYMTEDWMQVTWKRLGTRMLILTHNSGPLWPPIHTSSVKPKFYPLPTPINRFCGAPVPELREVLRVTYF